MYSPYPTGWSRFLFEVVEAGSWARSRPKGLESRSVRCTKTVHFRLTEKLCPSLNMLFRKAERPITFRTYCLWVIPQIFLGTRSRDFPNTMVCFTISVLPGKANTDRKRVKMDRHRGNRLIAEGLVDLVAFGRPRYWQIPDSWSRGLPMMPLLLRSIGKQAHASKLYGDPITQLTNHRKITPGAEHAADNTRSGNKNDRPRSIQNAYSINAIGVAAERYWPPNYIQHSAHIGSAVERVFFDLILRIPSTNT